MPSASARRRHYRRQYTPAPVVAPAFVAHSVRGASAPANHAHASSHAASGKPKGHSGSKAAGAHVASSHSAGSGGGLKAAHVAAAAVGGAAAAHVVATAAHANIYTPAEKGHAPHPTTAHTPPVVQPIAVQGTTPNPQGPSYAGATELGHATTTTEATAREGHTPVGHDGVAPDSPVTTGQDSPAGLVDETKQSIHDALHHSGALPAPANEGSGNIPVPDSGGPDWQQLVGALLAVLALAWIVLKGVLPKFVTSSGAQGLGGGALAGLSGVLPSPSATALPPFKIVSSLAMGPGQWLRMVQVGNEVLLISQTPSQIQLLKVCEPLSCDPVGGAEQAPPAGNHNDSTNPRFVTLTSQADISELAFEEVRVQGYPDQLL
jgi:flagellar biogenesis protein FliO